MHIFNMPSHYYEPLLNQKRIKKFNQVHVNSFFGRKKAAIFLRTNPIEDIELYISDPGYDTNLSKFYPIYMGKIVMIGYLILSKSNKYDFIIEDNKVIVRKNIVSNDTYEKGFISKHMLMLNSESANLFIPSLKYEQPQNLFDLV